MEKEVDFELKEWASRDTLPIGFTEWLKDLVKEQEIELGKGYSRIAEDLGVPSSILTRWIDGWGPLNQYDYIDGIVILV